MVGKYNMTTIKEIYLLLDRISKGFSIKIKKKEWHNTKKYIINEMAKAKEKYYWYLINKSKEGKVSMSCLVALWN